MDIKETIEQLRSLKSHCQSFEEDILDKDIQALDIAIQILKEKRRNEVLNDIKRAVQKAGQIISKRVQEVYEHIPKNFENIKTSEDRFNEIIEEQIEKCKETLIRKAQEYATEDRLHNFKVAAALEGKTPVQALAGMMAKHTVSIYDMCRDGCSNLNLWDEKITDHINYLLLLAALVREV